MNWMAKANYQNVNPRSIANKPERELRKMYSEFRSILRKRNERLEAAGRTPAFRTPSPVRGVPSADLGMETAKLAAILRSPQSSISGMLQRAKRTTNTLKSHGYDIDPDKLDDFGRFMEATRKRQGETYKGKSGVAAQAYTELVKTGVSGKTIERSFKKWLEDTDKLNDLVNAAQQARDTHPNRRVTARELLQIMKDFG